MANVSWCPANYEFFADWAALQTSAPVFEVHFHMARRRNISRVARVASMLAPALALCGLHAVHADGLSRRAWLGIELATGSRGSVVAHHVIRSSPAAQAGVLDGDELMSVDSIALTDPKQLIARVAVAGPTGKVVLRVRRRQADVDIAAPLAAFPGADAILRLDKMGTQAPDWTGAIAVSGVSQTNLSALRGRVIVLDFWASWCVPCRMMAPLLSRWQSSFGAQGLTVVGITSDAPLVAAQSALELGIKYAVASDESEKISGAYSVTSMPTLFVIDKKGVIREILIGYDPRQHAAAEQLIAKLLLESPDTSDPHAPRN